MTMFLGPTRNYFLDSAISFIYYFLVYFSAFVVGGIGGFGVTAGAHRLWTHRTYKAKWPLRVILLMCYAVAGQVSK